MTAIDDRLRGLGDHLDVTADDGSLVDGVLARLDAPPASSAGGSVQRRWLRVAAAALVLVAVAVAAIPSSRRTVAGWFGFEGATVERDPRVDAPDEPDPLDGRGTGTTVVVDGRSILVGEFVGTLEHPGLSKVLGTDSQVTEVAVGGAYALWIDGAPHEVSFFDAEGRTVFEGFAGDTLLWQDGDAIRRVEGFDSVDAAVDYAESVASGS